MITIFFLKNLVKYVFTGLLFSLIFLEGYAQATKLQQVTPKSPNIASLEKFTSVPVGLGTGTVNLSVPIYDIEVGGVKIPIALNYNNNGLVCDEIPSWVGLGWSLSTGGFLSYKQHGLNDFDPQLGLFPNGLSRLNSFFANQMSDFQRRNYFEDIMNGYVDSEHDEYIYNFPGNNGSFHFIDANTARTNPKTDIQVTKTPQGFKIVDDGGNTFFFESQESITSVNQEDYSTTFSDNSSFYVTKIITSDKKVVNFSYKSYSLQYTKTTSSLNFAVPNCSEYGGPSWTNIRTTINYLLPDEITFPSGSVKFTHSSDVRSDLLLINANTNVPYLKGVSVYNTEGKIREFSFDMSYFGTGNRLKLNSVAEVNNSQVLKHWDFEYNEAPDGSYPAIFSKAKDHWGYYNAKLSYNNNLPRANYSLFIPYYNNAIVPEAVRTSDFNAAKIGMIKSIKYPTGGRSDFEYEQNQFVFNNYADFDFEPFLEPANANSFTVAVAGGNATTGNTLTGSFTVPAGGAPYKFNSWRILSPDPFYNGPEILFTGPNNSTVAMLNSKVNLCNFPINQCTFSDIIFLEAGTYYYTIQGSSYQTNIGDTYYLYAGFDLLGRDMSSVKSYPVGGGRISKVISYASLGATPLIKKYIYNDSLSHVSLKSLPYYMSKRNIQKNGPSADGGTSPYCTPCGDLITVWEESVKPMVGPSIEYGLVKELTDEQGELGMTETYLSFSENLGAINTPPIVTPINTSWTAGQLIKENVYQKNMGNPKQEISVNYLSDYLSSQVHGIRVSYDLYCNGTPANTTYSVSPTTVYSGIYRPSSNVKKEVYNPSPIISDEIYSYDFSRHQKPSLISQTTSNGSENSQRKKYVFDYDNFSAAANSASLGLKLLKAGNMNLPIEELSIKKINNVDYVTGGALTVFKDSQTVPDSIYILNLDGPIPLSTFTMSAINSSGLFIKDARYKHKVSFDRYNPLNNNLLEQHVQGGSMTSYVYSYNSQYPIAEIKNADYASVESLLGGSSAVVAFGNLINPDKTAIDNFLLPLRNNLPDAFISSYVYKPLVGMTSQTDAKGMAVYYEYDAFQRLKLIRDQNNNIVKTYCYNYAGQATDCNVGGGITTPQPTQIYARIEVRNPSWSAPIDGSTTEADIYLALYSDAACTQPVSRPQGFDVSVSTTGTYFYNNNSSVSSWTNTYSVPANTDRVLLGRYVTDSWYSYYDPYYGTIINSENYTYQVEDNGANVYIPSPTY